MNLAYMELYLVLAGIFRVYDAAPSLSGQLDPQVVDRPERKGNDVARPEGKFLALYETVRERDVDLVHDLTVPGPVKGSKGVRVMVL